MEKLTEKQKQNIQFNNGFITAIGLFLSHERDEWNRDDNKRSLTIYCAADHLYDLEIPSGLPIKLKKRINKAVSEAFKYRLINTDKETVNKIFTEFKNILKELDEYLWKKEVYIGYY